MHHARWMSKAIYALKVLMFRSQFKLTAREEKGLRQIAVFISPLYTKAWTLALEAAAAPRHDLQLLKDLTTYMDIDRDVGKAACGTSRRSLSLWRSMTPWSLWRKRGKSSPHFTPQWEMNFQRSTQSCPAKPSLDSNCKTWHQPTRAGSFRSCAWKTASSTPILLPGWSGKTSG
jgi:hypothetical protein